MTQDDLNDITWGYHPDYEHIQANITDTGRWHTYITTIVKHTATGKFYSLSWSEAATENQEHIMPTEMTEVVPVEKTITVYEEAQ